MDSHLPLLVRIQSKGYQKEVVDFSISAPLPVTWLKGLLSLVLEWLMQHNFVEPIWQMASGVSCNPKAAGSAICKSCISIDSDIIRAQKVSHFIICNRLRGRQYGVM